MPTYSHKLLSGSTQGKPIKVTSTTTGAANTVHTAVAGTTNFDLIDIYATNNSASAVDINLGWGGVTVDETLGPISIAADAGPVKIADKFPLQNGLVVAAWASIADDILLTGVVSAYVA